MIEDSRVLKGVRTGLKVSLWVSLIFNLTFVVFYVKTCTDNTHLKNTNAELKNQVVELNARIGYLEDRVKAASLAASLSSERTNQKLDTIVQLVSTYPHRYDTIIVSSPVEQPSRLETSQITHKDYPVDSVGIARSYSAIIASSVRGTYWVVIGYSPTAEGAQSQADLARRRGFIKAGYSNPNRATNNPYYAVHAGPPLLWNASVELKKLARATYYKDAWIWPQ